MTFMQTGLMTQPPERPMSADGDGIVRDANGNPIGADPTNPNVAAMMAAQQPAQTPSGSGQITGTQITHIADEFAHIIPDILGAFGSKPKTATVAAPPAPSKMPLVIGLLAVAGFVLLYKHRK